MPLTSLFFEWWRKRASSLHMASRGRLVLLLLPLLTLLFLFTSSDASDTLSRGQRVAKDDTIVSAGNRFALGWFSPSNSGNHYIAIWYNNITPITTVWIANRNAPIKSAPGASFGISDDGNLEILDGNNSRPVWSSDASPSSPVNTTVRLRDSGNLVLLDQGGKELWQSFDHPTDTFLPNMTIKVDSETVTQKRFISWRSESDPANGTYSVGLDPLSLSQVYVWKGSEIWWRSGLWGQGTFIGTRMTSLQGYRFEFGNRTLSFVVTGSDLVRFVLQPDGVENVTRYDFEAKQWVPRWSGPVTECEKYNVCGSNMVCQGEGGGKSCECLKGYVQEEGGGGCVRREKLQCERGDGGGEDGFAEVRGVKLPDMAEVLGSVEFEDEEPCKKSCMENCTCGAYASVTGIGCMLWGREMLDLQSQEDGANVLHVKLSASELDGGKTWRLPLVVALVGFLMILLCSYLCWRYRTTILEWRKRRGAPTVSIADSSRIQWKHQDFACPSDVTESGNGAELPLYAFDAIATATDGFSFSNKLGEGGFGEVYKGLLPWGQEIAVKRLSQTSGQGLEEFKNEATVIAKLQHRNLVRLLGCCIERDEKMLVYEYLPNKSLYAIVFDPHKKGILDWSKRFNIIEGIARGLLYLHRDSRLRIVHRDLKASNVLLDEEMNPKISDFGVARIFGSHQNQENTNRVVGTFGYMSPEYAMEGLFSIKSDVYSFGVLMLEIISGRKNSSFILSKAGTNIAGYAWKLWNEGKAMELVDPSMGDSVSSQQVLRCIHVALLCVQDRAVNRPVMSSVILMLEGEASTLARPRPPTYALVGSSSSNTESSDMGKEHFTSSDATVTSLLPR